MKIALITGSAREKGNTNRMADAFQQEAEQLGIEIVRIDSTKLNIGPCIGCCKCYSTGKPCVFDQDDFNAVFQKIAVCDGQVWCAPLYWYTFPAKPKALMDRFYCYYTAGRDGGALMEGKKVALISACEEETADYFQGMEFAFDTSFNLLKAEIVGKVLVPNTNAIGDIEKTDGEAKAKALAHAFIE